MSITLTIYNLSHDTTRRVFYLRNLAGDSEAEHHINQAKQLMHEVAAEIHYLTGFGVDKGVVKLDGRPVAEGVYPDFETSPRSHFFH